ncbi:hypothetical protein Bca101_080271 [Brassica carinata]
MLNLRHCNISNSNHDRVDFSFHGVSSQSPDRRNERCNSQRPRFNRRDSEPTLGANISMIVDVSVKNPNYVTFRKGQSALDGEDDMTVDIRIDRLVLEPGLVRKISGSGLVNLWSYTKVSGKVKIMGIVKKHVTVKMNCTMAVNISRQAIQDVECKNSIDL